MICPEDKNKEFDEEGCKLCHWYFVCFNLWQKGNIWGEDSNSFTNDFKSINKDIITLKDINKFKKELENIIYYSDWEKKINETFN